MLRILPSTHMGRLLARRASRLGEAESIVRPILENVRKNGDRALIDYARQLDGFTGVSIRVTPKDMAAAASRLPRSFRVAVKTASANIRRFAQLQMPPAFVRKVAPGVTLGQIVRPLDTVAAYIPAGRYPLVSTLLMTVTPAHVAGVPNVCVSTPRPVPEILGAAHLARVSQMFAMGGAHAIAAFAYGTRTVPKADRIVGPGNIYVAAAKKLLAGEVGIDFIAGPTEIVIIAAEGNPAWIAADMLAQAEHDVDAAAILFTTSSALAAAVAREVERQIADLPTASVARKAIEKNSAIVLVDSLEQAIELANKFAPEHLSLPDKSLLKQVRHAGSLFIGPLSPEAAGDYASGPNHVLPTTGAARLRGGLSVADYVKVISVQQLDARALRGLAPTITTLARAEGLEAHARSIEVRTRGKSA
jgi:histidinol dehydrogenase